jgi:hypothetical protein
VSKFKEGDIVSRDRDPIVILGTHEFPDGTPAYRYRSCLPQYDLEDGSELWPDKDSYNSQEYIDRLPLLWRKSE